MKLNTIYNRLIIHQTHLNLVPSNYPSSYNSRIMHQTSPSFRPICTLLPLQQTYYTLDQSFLSSHLHPPSFTIVVLYTRLVIPLVKSKPSSIYNRRIMHQTNPSFLTIYTLLPLQQPFIHQTSFSFRTIYTIFPLQQTYYTLDQSFLSSHLQPYFYNSSLPYHPPLSPFCTLHCYGQQLNSQDTLHRAP